MDPNSPRRDKWIPSPDDPLFNQRNPFETFMMTWALLAALPLLGGSSGSQVLDENIALVTVVAWGSSLLLGTTMALAGTFWPRRLWTGLVIERSGCILIAGAASVYAYVVWNQAPATSDVRYALYIQIAFAMACVWRAVQITRRLAWARRQVSRIRRRA